MDPAAQVFTIVNDFPVFCVILFIAKMLVSSFFSYIHIIVGIF